MTTNSIRPELLRKDVEHTSGPFGGGIAVTAWKAIHQDAECPVKVRLITVADRTYYDAEGDKYESSFYRVDDIPALILALQKMLEYCYEHPLCGDGTSDSDIRH